jgi:uncharacterized protein
MGRILLIIAALFVLVWLLRGVLLTRKRDQPRAPEKLPGDLVSCAQCGVHLPRAEARSAGGLHFCSEEHWRLGPRERK